MAAAGGVTGAAGHWGGAASAGPAAGGGVAGHWGPAAGAASVGPAGPPAGAAGPAAGGRGVAGGGGQPGAGGCAAGPYGAAGPCPPLVSSFHISLIGSSGQTATRACCGHITGAGCEGRETSLRNPPNPGCRSAILLPPRHSVDNVRYSACSGRVPGRLAKPEPAECQRAALLRTRPIPRAHTDHESAASARSRGRRRPSRSTGRTVPSVRPRRPSTHAVRRRRPRASVLRTLWACDSPKAKTAARTAPDASFGLGVVSGQDGERTPRRGEHDIAVEPPAPQLEVVRHHQTRPPPRRTTAGSSRPGSTPSAPKPPRRRGRRCRPR